MISGNMETALWRYRKRSVRPRINEDISLREMGIYHHISAALLRFIQGASECCWRSGTAHLQGNDITYMWIHC